MTADPSGSGPGPGRDAAAGEPLQVCLVTLPAAGQAAGMARRRVRDALASWGLVHLEETATLLVSELVGNAVRHARTDEPRLELRIEAAGTWLRIEVADGDRRPPRPRAPSGLDKSGFGFVLVEALAGKWGVRETATGKAVWIELTTEQADEPGDELDAIPACGVLAGHQNRLARDQELLVEGHRRLADAQARFGTGMNGRFPEHLVSVVSDRAEIGELSAALANTARRDWMTLENLDTDMPLTEDFAQLPLPAYGGRVRCRSIYDAAVMEFPAARRVIQACAEAGEQARLLPRVPMKMKLADQMTTMLPLTPTGTAGALVIRAPVIISALREYFELLWDRATPLRPRPGRGPADRLTSAQQSVLELMAQGLTDAVIARRAGVSVTTIRRHITAVMTRLGVSSRFAAGAAAHRQGWIG
jgi:DNA-binding CsgD family transcriptional regulator/anti-sigma regulatory factor (Ser/Thr protein kinase)